MPLPNLRSVTQNIPLPNNQLGNLNPLTRIKSGYDEWRNRPLERSFSRQIVPQLREGVRWFPQSAKEYVKTIPEGVMLTLRASDPISAMGGELMGQDIENEIYRPEGEGLGRRTAKAIYEGKSVYGGLRQKGVHPAAAFAAEFATPSLWNLTALGQAAKNFSKGTNVASPSFKTAMSAVGKFAKDSGIALTRPQMAGIAVGFEPRFDENGNFAGMGYNEKRAGAALLAVNLGAPIAGGLLAGKGAKGFEDAAQFQRVAEGPGGDVKFEIPDTDAKLTLNADGLRGIRRAGKGMTFKLGDLMENDDLFKNYPEMKDVNVEITSDQNDFINPTALAETDDATQTVRIRPLGSAEAFKTNLIHELQHVVQGIEGFKAGTLPEAQASDPQLMVRKNMLQQAVTAADLKDQLGSWSKAQAALAEDVGQDIARSAVRNAKQFDGVEDIKMSLRNIISAMELDEWGKYASSLGETEAAAVETRVGMSPEELASTDPYGKLPPEYEGISGKVPQPQTPYRVVVRSGALSPQTGTPWILQEEFFPTRQAAEAFAANYEGATATGGKPVNVAIDQSMEASSFPGQSKLANVLSQMGISGKVPVPGQMQLPGTEAPPEAPVAPRRIPLKYAGERVGEIQLPWTRAMIDAEIEARDTGLDTRGIQGKIPQPMEPKAKQDLIDEFVNLYRQTWGTNAGLSTKMLNEMSPEELQRNINSLRISPDMSGMSGKVPQPDEFAKSVVADTLINDEVSTDAELKQYLMEEAGISDDVADKVLSMRTRFLNATPWETMQDSPLMREIDQVLAGNAPNMSRIQAPEYELKASQVGGKLDVLEDDPYLGYRTVSPRDSNKIYYQDKLSGNLTAKKPYGVSGKIPYPSEDEIIDLEELRSKALDAYEVSQNPKDLQDFNKYDQEIRRLRGLRIQVQNTDVLQDDPTKPYVVVSPRDGNEIYYMARDTGTLYDSPEDATAMGTPAEEGARAARSGKIPKPGTLPPGIKYKNTATGTGFAGYLNTTYDDLVAKFGYPNLGASPDGKIQAEWSMEVDGKPVTIYDYKSDLPPEQVTRWHVGSKKQIPNIFKDMDFELMDAPKGYNSRELVDVDTGKPDIRPAKYGETNGTSLKGYIRASFDDLVKQFGPPTGGGDKSDIVFEVMINGKPVTIYDWKVGKNYLGEMEGADVTQGGVRQWNVGGREIDPTIKSFLNQFQFEGWPRSGKVPKPNSLTDTEMEMVKGKPYEDTVVKRGSAQDALNRATEGFQDRIIRQRWGNEWDDAKLSQKIDGLRGDIDDISQKFAETGKVSKRDIGSMLKRFSDGGDVPKWSINDVYENIMTDLGEFEPYKPKSGKVPKPGKDMIDAPGTMISYEGKTKADKIRSAIRDIEQMSDGSSTFVREELVNLYDKVPVMSNKHIIDKLSMLVEDYDTDSFDRENLSALIQKLGGSIPKAVRLR